MYFIYEFIINGTRDCDEALISFVHTRRDSRGGRLSCGGGGGYDHPINLRAAFCLWRKVEIGLFYN